MMGKSRSVTVMTAYLCSITSLSWTTVINGRALGPILRLILANTVSTLNKYRLVAGTNAVFILLAV